MILEGTNQVGIVSICDVNKIEPMQDVRGHFQTNLLKLLPVVRPFYIGFGDPFGYSLATLFCNIVLCIMYVESS